MDALVGEGDGLEDGGKDGADKEASDAGNQGGDVRNSDRDLANNGEGDLDLGNKGEHDLEDDAGESGDEADDGLELEGDDGEDLCRDWLASFAN